MRAKINKNLLFGQPNSKQRDGFYWDYRYSDTNQSDKKGRWARICYYNGLRIANISGHLLENKILVEDKCVCTPNSFLVWIFFPASSNESYGTEIFEKEIDAKKWVEEMFTSFKNHIK